MTTADRLNAATESARAGALEDAVKLAEEAVAEAPEGAEGQTARLALAGYLAELGEFDRAESLAEGAKNFAAKPDHPSIRSGAHAVEAHIASGRGKFEEAAELFRNALFEENIDLPKEWRISVELGLAQALAQSGDRDSAKSEALRALKHAREREDSYFEGLATAAAALAGAADAEQALRALLAGPTPPPPVEWFSHFALGEVMSARGEETAAEKEFASALNGLRSIWSALSPKRRSTYLSTAPLKRFCARLVACAGEGPAFQAEATVVREIHREVLEEAEGIELDGLEDVIGHVGDPLLTNRLESFRANFRNLMRLQEVIKAVNSEQNLDRLLALIMDHAVEIAGAERGFMMLLEGKNLKFRIARNIDQEKIRKPEFKISYSIAEESFRTGKAILTANAKEDPRFAGAGSVHDLKLTSVLCHPLQIRERTTGVVYLDNRFRPGRFTPDILRLLEMFSDQAAIALENARLLEENRRAKEELETLNEKLSDANVHLSARVREQEEALSRARMEAAAPVEPRKYGPLVSRSPAMEEIFKLLDKVVESDVPVLVQGESGTGKELVARVIHEKSSRSKGAFVSENCGALSDTLLESELFGHVRGAFTGAVADRVGLFELAHGGTLMLDEVGEMSPEMQKKLLRALQEGEVRPVGAKRARKVDVRVISASNRNLREMAKSGEFREDLFFRLNVLQIDLPPLREKPEDIPVLLEYFFGESGVPEFDPATHRRVMRYGWPGNVRELRNFVERTKALKVEKIGDGDLPPEMTETRSPGQDWGGISGSLLEMEEGFMRGVIQKALTEAGGNKTKAADALGIPKTTLYNKMKKYGIAEEIG
ncbi:MAG: sigma 54-interacting transcriptional regulator [Planctomycetota bacterium]|jgi:transcriptional regulator with GAF, ATPase, and Fis domain